MANPLVRVGGGRTSINFNNQVLAFCQVLNDSGQTAKGQVSEVQGIDSQYVTELAIPNQIGMGTLTLQVWDQYLQEAWQYLPGFAGAQDLLEVLQANQTAGAITVTKIITPPAGSPRTTTFTGCAVGDVTTGETINIGQMQVSKSFTIYYIKRIGSTAAKSSSTGTTVSNTGLIG